MSINPVAALRSRAYARKLKNSIKKIKGLKYVEFAPENRQ